MEELGQRPYKNARCHLFYSSRNDAKHARMRKK